MKLIDSFFLFSLRNSDLLIKNKLDSCHCKSTQYPIALFFALVLFLRGKEATDGVTCLDKKVGHLVPYSAFFFFFFG